MVTKFASVCKDREGIHGSDDVAIVACEQYVCSHLWQRHPAPWAALVGAADRGRPGGCLSTRLSLAPLGVRCDLCAQAHSSAGVVVFLEGVNEGSPQAS